MHNFGVQIGRDDYIKSDLVTEFQLAFLAVTACPDARLSHAEISPGSTASITFYKEGWKRQWRITIYMKLTGIVEIIGERPLTRPSLIRVETDLTTDTILQWVNGE